MGLRNIKYQPIVSKVEHDDGVVERLADIQYPGRTVVENRAEPRRYAARFVIAIVPVPPQQRTHRADRSQPVYVLSSVFLNEAAVREHHAEHRTGGAVRRVSEKRGADRSPIQRAGNDLGGLARREIAGEDASGESAGSPGQGNPARVNNGRRADPRQSSWRIGRPQSPECVVYRET